MAMILDCTCKSEYQDKTYGPGNRVHNETKGKNGNDVGGARCTVCGTKKELR